MGLGEAGGDLVGEVVEDLGEAVVRRVVTELLVGRPALFVVAGGLLGLAGGCLARGAGGLLSCLARGLLPLPACRSQLVLHRPQPRVQGGVRARWAVAAPGGGCLL